MQSIPSRHVSLSEIKFKFLFSIFFALKFMLAKFIWAIKLFQFNVPDYGTWSTFIFLILNFPKKLN